MKAVTSSRASAITAFGLTYLSSVEAACWETATKSCDCIEALYRASRAGVEIDLIIRGACALRPNVRDLSHRIRVRSIVGRFLEHSRIFYFENGGQPDMYLGSADWMPRNLYERVEVMFPINTPALRERLFGEILQSYLKDNEKTRLLLRDGSYARAYQASPNKFSRNGNRFSAQAFFVDLAEGKNQAKPVPPPVIAAAI